MKLVKILLSCIIVIVFSCQNRVKQNNTLTKTEEKEGWELLFDGQSIKDWRFFKGDEIKEWKVVDGVLYNSGTGSDHGGDIITKETYKDFELYLEWKISPSSNSGVFYHVQELDSIQAIYESGPEYQLMDDASAKVGSLSSQRTGANYSMNEPIGAKVKPLDQWNETRIIVKGPHVEHWLNGVKVVEYELWSEDWVQRKNDGKWKNYPYYGIAKDGYIGLQDHGGLTQFRNIKIRKL